MRDTIIGITAVAAVFSGVYFYPNDSALQPGDSSLLFENGLYNMSQQDVIAQLVAAPVPAGKPPFFGWTVAARATSANTVGWFKNSGPDHQLCQAMVTAVGNTQSKVETDCSGMPTEGAAADIGAKMHNSGFAELVASTLQGRAVNQGKVSGEAVVAVVKGLPEAQNSALQMHKDMEILSAAANKPTTLRTSDQLKKEQAERKETYIGNDPTKFPSN